MSDRLFADSLMPKSNSGFVGVEPPVRRVGVHDLVRQIEEDKSENTRELGEAKATMIVNYGSNGQTRKALIKDSDSLVQMIMKVCTYYEENCKSVLGAIEREKSA